MESESGMNVQITDSSENDSSASSESSDAEMTKTSNELENNEAAPDQVSLHMTISSEDENTDKSDNSVDTTSLNKAVPIEKSNHSQDDEAKCDEVKSQINISSDDGSDDLNEKETQSPKTSPQCHIKEAYIDMDETKNNEKQTTIDTIPQDETTEMITQNDESKPGQEVNENQDKSVTNEMNSKNDKQSKTDMDKGDYRKKTHYDSDGDDEDSDQSDPSDSENVVPVPVPVVPFASDDEDEARRPVKTRGELSVEDLPPIEELKITVSDSVNMIDIGNISAVVGVLVVVMGKPDQSALDADSILFLADRKPFGKVFETFGPVKMPFYSVRFNSTKDIEAMGIQVGQTIYYAPEEKDFTSYVFVNKLKKVKGSDASWTDNNEPPANQVEYSDDESERIAKKKRPRKTSEGEEREAKSVYYTDDSESTGQGQEIQSWPPRSNRGSRGGKRVYHPPARPQILPDGYTLPNEEAQNQWRPYSQQSHPRMPANHGPPGFNQGPPPPGLANQIRGPRPRFRGPNQNRGPHPRFGGAPQNREPHPLFRGANQNRGPLPRFEGANQFRGQHPRFEGANQNIGLTPNDNNHQGGFQNQPGRFQNQPVGFQNQQGGFQNQPGGLQNQQGGFQNQPGGFQNRTHESNGQNPGSFQPQMNRHQGPQLNNATGPPMRFDRPQRPFLRPPAQIIKQEFSSSNLSPYRRAKNEMNNDGNYENQPQQGGPSVGDNRSKYQQNPNWNPQLSNATGDNRSSYQQNPDGNSQQSYAMGDNRLNYQQNPDGNSQQNNAMGDNRQKPQENPYWSSQQDYSMGDNKSNSQQNPNWNSQQSSTIGNNKSNDQQNATGNSQQSNAMGEYRPNYQQNWNSQQGNQFGGPPRFQSPRFSNGPIVDTRYMQS